MTLRHSNAFKMLQKGFAATNPHYKVHT